MLKTPHSTDPFQPDGYSLIVITRSQHILCFQNQRIPAPAWDGSRPRAKRFQKRLPEATAIELRGNKDLRLH